MDYFNYYCTFLGIEGVSCIAVYGGSESSRISLKISCVSKMSEGLAGLGRLEGE